MNVQMNSNERRAKLRFPWQREVRYKVLEDDRIVASGLGETTDIGSNGIAFCPDRQLKQGAFVELAVAWPVLLNDVCPMRLVAFGRVVRSNGLATACTIDRWEFRTQARELRPVIPMRTDSTLRRWADGVRREEVKASAMA